MRSRQKSFKRFMYKVIKIIVSQILRHTTSEAMHLAFYEQLGPGLSPQSCLCFQDFWGSKLINGCLVV